MYKTKVKIKIEQATLVTLSSQLINNFSEHQMKISSICQLKSLRPRHFRGITLNTKHLSPSTASIIYDLVYPIHAHACICVRRAVHKPMVGVVLHVTARITDRPDLQVDRPKWDGSSRWLQCETRRPPPPVGMLPLPALQSSLEALIVLQRVRRLLRISHQFS